MDRRTYVVRKYRLSPGRREGQAMLYVAAFLAGMVAGLALAAVLAYWMVLRP